ncbi:hypothetical protein H8D91_00345 [archaeon]|nr:hypothetical protein [archaeon]
MDNTPLWYAAGIAAGMGIGLSGGSSNNLDKYTFKKADLNGDGMKQEMIASKGNKQLAYFPDTNRVYRLAEDFDFSSLTTNLESTVEAEE